MNHAEGTLRLCIFPTLTGASLHVVNPNGTIFSTVDVPYGQGYQDEIAGWFLAMTDMRKYYERAEVHDFRPPDVIAGTNPDQLPFVAPTIAQDATVTQGV